MNVVFYVVAIFICIRIIIKIIVKTINKYFGTPLERSNKKEYEAIWGDFKTYKKWFNKNFHFCEGKPNDERLKEYQQWERDWINGKRDKVMFLNDLFKEKKTESFTKDNENNDNVCWVKL